MKQKQHIGNRFFTFRRIFLCLICFLLFFPYPTKASADTAEETYSDVAQSILSVVKEKNGKSSEKPLLEGTFLENAANPSVDWYALAAARLTAEEDFTSYLAVVSDKVAQAYETPQRLDATRATEWHRLILSMAATGGDPSRVAGNIDLIADGVYNRGKVKNLGAQGVNGYIFALLALDAEWYDVPESAFQSRRDIVTEILKNQLPDGGFALSGEVADVDMTAMALTALAPYVNSRETYRFVPERTDGQTQREITVRAAASAAVSCLSRLQREDGGFASYGTPNVESACQVILALTSVGVDVSSDERFIKNGKTVVDGVMQYRQGGGFAHSFVSTAGGETANQQALCAMVALWRQQNGLRAFYDMRAEHDENFRAALSALVSAIDSCDDTTEKSRLENLTAEFYAFHESERRYVTNFSRLYGLAKAKDVDFDEIEAQTDVRYIALPKETTLVTFSDADKRAADTLPDLLTTQQYVETVTLLYKLQHGADFDGKSFYLQKLTAADKQIKDVFAEISSLNDAIARLPAKATLTDKKTTDDLWKRYQALSDYDKGKIAGADDLEKAKLQADGALRALFIALFSAVGVAVILFFIVVNVRKRKNRKQKELDELASRFEDEE